MPPSMSVSDSGASPHGHALIHRLGYAGLIPLVGLVLIYFMVQPTQPEPNPYGVPPSA